VELSNVDKKTLEGQESVRLCNYVDVYYNERISANLEFMAATATWEQVGRFSLLTGDVLITKDSESWTDIAVSAVVAEDLPGVLCGYHLALIRPGVACCGTFLARAFSAIGPRDQFQLAANGITRFGIGGDAIRTGVFAIPPTDEQRFITAFLDIETTKIDVLIAKNGRLIELLREKRIALISRAVTKGLDPDVPMKDSGVEWLGEIPAHWEQKPLRYTVLTCQNGIWGDEPDGMRDIVCVRVADFDRLHFKVDLANPTFRAVDRDAITTRGLRPGDLLLEKSGGGENQPVGAVVLYDHAVPAVCSNFVAHIVVAKDNDARFLSFVHAALYALRVNTRHIKQSTGIQNLDSASYLSETMGFPPEHEQRAIVRYIDVETAKIDDLVSKVRDAIDHLREFRTALISAAVTGRIDVRDIVDGTEVAV
jgi:type I restriction enzyme S subunit